jgi:hypothetical protein
MPRLVGKQSSKDGHIAITVLAIAAIAVAFEYSGLVNYVPEFGRDNTSLIREQNVQ